MRNGGLQLEAQERGSEMGLLAQFGTDTSAQISRSSSVISDLQLPSWAQWSAGGTPSATKKYTFSCWF